METIYKIKIRTDQNTSASYPSERRYSASKVLGLAIIYIAIACFALLFTIIIFILMSSSSSTHAANSTETFLIEENMQENNMTHTLQSLSFVSNISVASILLFIGSLVSSIGGFMAWKRWYIDATIKWFFMTSCFAFLLSSISLALLTWTIAILHYHNYLEKDTSSFQPFYHLSVNILIASIAGFLWSLISIRISYQGMSNPYQDNYDLNTLTKTDSNWKKISMPPDIINHFSTGQKVIKYWPKKENTEVSNVDNNSLYEEKINYYLSSNSDVTDKNNLK